MIIGRALDALISHPLPRGAGDGERAVGRRKDFRSLTLAAESQELCIS